MKVARFSRIVRVAGKRSGKGGGAEKKEACRPSEGRTAGWLKGENGRNVKLCSDYLIADGLHSRSASADTLPQESHAY
jgi:hypothetical protein